MLCTVLTPRSRALTPGYDPHQLSMPTRSTSLEEDRITGVSTWLVGVRPQLQRLFEARPLAQLAQHGFKYELRHAGESLWLIVNWPSRMRVACCVANALGAELKLMELHRDASAWKVRAHGIVGDYTVQVELHKSTRSLVRWRTSLRPSVELTFADWPRDLLPVDEDGDPLNTRGIIHVCQRGPQGNVCYAAVTRPAPGGSLLYMQNLGSLAEYFEQTHTSAADRIGGNWPQLGFSLPPAMDTHALSPHHDIVVSDAFIVGSESVPDDDISAAKLFLDLYAELYLAIDRPPVVHRNWQRRVDETLQDLTHSPDCGVDIDAQRYLRAYAGVDDRPVESMVQLAVLVPLVEYAETCEYAIPLCDVLRKGIPSFFDDEVGTVVRWLPKQQSLLNGKEEQMQPYVMDSWYLWHTYLNLARMAQLGDQMCRRLFLRSVEHGIKIAQRFDYRWPVFYDARSLDVVKAETQPGKGGEHDVGALYAHVMIKAYELTKDRRFIDEAVRAARQLRGLGFKLGYQFNNVSFGAGALHWLAKETGEEQFRGLSLVCWANLVANLWLWRSGHGYAKHYGTFMGLPPLQDALYLALYEELEVLAAVHEYMKIAGDEVPPALRVLLPEYCKYLIDRAWYHYPSELPADMVVDKPNSGKIHRYLSVPLEDLYEGWEKAGKVGQEVYGAAAPFIIVTRHWHSVPGEPFKINCTYPVDTSRMEFMGRRGKRRGGSVVVRILGDRRCRCHIRIVPTGLTPMPPVRLSIRQSDGWSPREGRLAELGYLEFELPGDAEVRIEWRHRSDPAFNGQARNGRRRAHGARAK